MFYNASAFNQPLDSWDVSNVRSIRGMFEQAYAFNQPLDAWNVKDLDLLVGGR
jgi:surface protein